ncbi:ABC transporter substrate-binding protein [Pseudarthrobacter sp. H2]|uniref:ABC transporter substrate-binding protein n=1 Tax=Pseudarthrobacter sp. H2 TaxID=3418415 RepID=UPI003CEE78CB
MPKFFKTSVVLVLSLSALGSLNGCSSGGANTGQPGGSGKNSLVVAYFGQLDTLDPVATRTQTGYVVQNMYESLVSHDNSGALSGQLAEKYEVSGDAQSISITLREGVKFHDGSPLVSGDVKYSLERYRAVGSGVAGYLGDYESTDIKDDRTFTIKLSKPNAIFLDWLSLVYIVSEKLVKPNEGSDHAQAWLQSNEAGTGAFSLEKKQTSGDIVLKRFADYWQFDGKRADSVVFKRIDQSATQRQNLLDGSVDIAFGLNAADADALKGTKVKVNSMAAPSSDYIYLNSQNGPTADPQVREALQLAFDYKGALESIRKGHGQISKGILPNTLPCAPAGPEHKQDLAKAKQLMADAAVTKLTLNFQPVVPLAQDMATLMQSNLREIGVQLDLVPIGFPDYLAKLSDPTKIPQMMLALEGVPMPEAGAALFQQYTTSRIGTTNRSAYSNPAVDATLDQASKTADTTVRCGLYTQAETQIFKDRPVLNLLTVDSVVGYRDGLTGIRLNPDARPIRVSDLRFE